MTVRRPRPGKALGLLAALVQTVVSVLLFLTVAALLIGAVRSVLTGLQPPVAAAALTGLVVVGSTMLTYRNGKRNDERHSRQEAVRPVYTVCIDRVARELATPGPGPLLDGTAVLGLLRPHAADLAVWGSPRVVKAVGGLLTLDSAPSRAQAVDALAGLFLLMRADMGIDNAGLTAADLRRLFAGPPT